MWPDALPAISEAQSASLMSLLAGGGLTLFLKSVPLSRWEGLEH